MTRAILILLLAAASCFAARDTFEAKETELRAFENHDEVLLTLTKPLYRIGEILQLNDERYVVVLDYKWQSNHWSYTVTPVKVGAR